jgi:hypothetical protein
MITKIQLGGIHSRDAEVNNYLSTIAKPNKQLQVIDIGASANFWCNHVTAAVDIVDPNQTEVKYFTGNINLPDVWNTVLEYVKVHGKFDFSICTHTLEDISNPVLVAQMLGKISNKGFVSMPSKYAETKRTGAIGGSRGWMHHRWIFNHEQDQIVAYPKIPVTEYLKSLDIVAVQSSTEELSFYWKDSCNIVAVNNDFFPSDPEGVAMYDRLIDRTIELS